MSAVKQCGNADSGRGCGETKPLDEFSSWIELNRDGVPVAKHHTYCKACRNYHAKQRGHNRKKPRPEAVFRDRPHMLDVLLRATKIPAINPAPLRWTP